MKRLIIIVVMFAGLVGFVESVTEQNDYQQLYEDLLYPSVKITSGIGTGSGVVIHSEPDKTYLLTAAHVVGDDSTVTATFYYCHEDTKTLSASVVITDTVKDLALLKIDKPYPYVAKLGSRNYTPYIFTPVWVVGCSLGLDPRPSEGIITVISDNAWEMSAPIVPGNSGGGVFLKDTHELIGIAVWVRGYRKQLITTMAGIVPLQDIYKFLDNTSLMNCEEHKSRGETAGGLVESVSTALSGGLVHRPYLMKGGEK